MSAEHRPIPHADASTRFMLIAYACSPAAWLAPRSARSSAGLVVARLMRMAGLGGAPLPVLILALVLGLATSPAHADAEMRAAARALNAELAVRIDCRPGVAHQVGIFPFDEGRLPMSPPNAFALYEGFLGMLLEEAPDCLRYIDGRGAMVTLSYLGQTGTLRETGQAHRAEIEQRLAGVDHVLDGTIIEQGDALRAVFRLTEFETGAASARAEFRVPDRFREAACGAGALPIEVATRRLAGALADRAPGMAHLTVIGGYYGHGDAQTGFSRFLESELVSALVQAVENPITGRFLSVTNLREQQATQLRATRGLDITAHEFDEGATQPAMIEAGEAGHYRLRFRYWPCEGDGAARLAVTLQGPEGRDIAEIAHVSLAGLPAGTALHPETAPVQAEWGPDGAFSFQITSQRGPNPAFRAGETLEALFRTGRDAWLYCFYTDSSGATIQLLPNPLQIDQPEAHFYAGGRVHLFPDRERLPHPDRFDLVINDDTVGVEVLRCLATPRDITADLPAALRGRSFEAIPPRYATRLQEIFRDVAGRRVATASITVTVLE